MQADGIASGAIGQLGMAVVPDFIPSDLVARLRQRALALDASGGFAAASVGRGAGRAHHGEERGDRIRWIDLPTGDPDEAALAKSLDALRLEVNRSLSLGAFDLEMHYAIYPPGSGYARHRDRFRDDDARVLSCVVYLNDGWGDDDGGALRLHLEHGAQDVAPRAGTLVAFLSERVEHEVLPARRQRLAVAGWYRRR